MSFKNLVCTRFLHPSSGWLGTSSTKWLSVSSRTWNLLWPIDSD